MSLVWLILAIVLEIVSTLGLRFSEGFKKRAWILPVIVSYAVSFFFLWLALKTGMPVAIAYGIWTAVGIVAVAFLAKVFWGDPLTRRMIFGIVLISAGVFLVELG